MINNRICIGKDKEDKQLRSSKGCLPHIVCFHNAPLDSLVVCLLGGEMLTVGSGVGGVPFSTFIKAAFSIVTTTA